MGGLCFPFPPCVEISWRLTSGQPVLFGVCQLGKVEDEATLADRVNWNPALILTNKVSIPSVAERDCEHCLEHMTRVYLL